MATSLTRLLLSHSSTSTWVPVSNLGELEPIKLLPVMVDACVDTLSKVWTSKVDLHVPGGHPRLQSIATLEEAVLQLIPPGMKRPADLVKAALHRIAHAPSVLGAIEVPGMTELEPCWRPLLVALATVNGPTRVAFQLARLLLQMGVVMKDKNTLSRV